MYLALTDSDVKLSAGCKPWSNAMEILDEKDGVDTELLVYAMTLINKVGMGVMTAPNEPWLTCLCDFFGVHCYNYSTHNTLPT